MNTTLSSATFHAESPTATAATRYVSEDIMVYARDNNCSIVTLSHAMIRTGDQVLVTAIAIFQTITE